MKLLKFSTALLVASPLIMAVIAACSSPNNPMLAAQPEKAQMLTASSGATEAAKVPEVDILFVADDSDSMTKHLALVHANMDTFANQFAAVANVDYHVGLVKVFDSTRYGTPKVPVFVANGELQNDELDKELVASLLAKTPAATDADQKALVENTPQWIGRTTDAAVNTTNLKKLLEFNTKTIAAGGPNKEEIFSPISTMLQDPAISSVRNRGFLRPEANLAIIILTDAEDSSPNLTFDELKNQLALAKGGDLSKVSVYAALALGTCPMDIDHQAPDKIRSLITDVNGDVEGAKHIFNLCGDFGKTMAAVGHDIAVRANVDSVIPLQQYPASLSQVIVSYGPPGAPNSKLIARTDWTYDNVQNRVVVNPNAQGITVTPGTKFYAVYPAMRNQDLARRRLQGQQ